MKREEKNQQTRRRIMDSALAEFAANGYGGSSVNTICAAQGISKGIVYHYFESKDELYLACVEECFQCLTAHLSAALPEEDEPADPFDLERYVLSEISSEKILELVGGLPEELRSVFLLKYAYDLPHKQIGQLLGIRENTATVRLHRAKKRLMAMLIKEGYAVETEA